MTRTVAVVGGGPAGLMAAELLSAAGLAVDLYERMPTLGRKLLMAGRGGLNLTHSEPIDAFLPRYAEAAPRLSPLLNAFPPSALIAWAEGLGQPTFVGSSGRVFPKALKASPLLRAWLARLSGQGVRFHLRHRWTGWTPDGALALVDERGAPVVAQADAVVLALGGASWPRLGSDGGWAHLLTGQGVEVAPLRPANCGFRVAWSDVFRARFAGQPLKSLAVRFEDREVRGELTVADYGIEGGAVYALSAPLRDRIAASGSATLSLDLRPDLPQDRLTARLARTPEGQSAANRLRKAGLSPLEVNLLREAHGLDLSAEPATLAARIKAVPVTLTAPTAIDRAISTAGGVAFTGLDDDLMLKARPGVFVAGEMLDWEAPTGGYLLQACFATGAAAARGVVKLLGAPTPSSSGLTRGSSS